MRVMFDNSHFRYIFEYNDGSFYHKLHISTSRLEDAWLSLQPLNEWLEYQKSQLGKIRIVEVGIYKADEYGEEE